jgi:predicted transcriptional regulator YheO
LLAPHGEVALHDLASDRIVALWNPISGRQVGDPSLIAELGDLGADGPIGPYPTTLPDGRRVTAVSAVVPDAEGRPSGLLCVNVDRTPLDALAAIATTWLVPRVDPPDPLLRRDWRELIGRRVGDFCAGRGVRAAHLDAASRLELVRLLDGEGLFAVRRAADLVAGALGVSRATVYADLKTCRRESGEKRRSTT